MIKYQLLHKCFDQISDQKHDIDLYGKLFTKLLAQVAIKVISMVSEVTIWKKFQTNTSVS